ncbi:hypothetical protein CLAIMM_04642 [Cladophialophora immunda]|nr:hypothetical protein CLAIMM_04642 [Cladophialophora immunda]
MGDLPTIRWGIIATGLISSWFVEDILLERPDAKVKHIVHAIGSSSLEKGNAFIEKYCPKEKPTLYDSYTKVYEDKEVDVVYIGTPHSFHRQQCLDAIAAGKNVLCEKPFAINAPEAKEVFDAAREKGIYVAEAMWTRHRPLVATLRKLLFEEKVIGDVYRSSCDFSLDLNIPNLPESSRHRNPSLGAGTWLDQGVYSLTWAMLTLDAGLPEAPETPKIVAAQTQKWGVDVLTTAIVLYPSTGRQGVVSSNALGNNGGDTEVIVRIHGTNGYIEVEGPIPPLPLSFTVYERVDGDPNEAPLRKIPEKRYEFPAYGRGFVFEADNTALDILEGRKESQIMPHSETLRVMELMDEVRRQGGTRYLEHDK